MLIKSADDQSKRILLLEELQKSDRLDARQIQWLQAELRNLKQGQQGESSAAHYLDRYYKDSETHAVLHGLRLIVDEEVAQIDHLIISRAGLIYLLKTKHFNGNIDINAHGGFTASYGSVKYGIPSPLEQSKRHEPVLTKLLERLEISGRVFKTPQFQHVVLLNPRSIIGRPDAKAFDASNVVKADQFQQWRDKFLEKETTFFNTLALLANMRGAETLPEWGEKLRRQHQPNNALDLPDFMQPKAPAIKASKPTVQPATKSTSPIEVEEKKRLICATCGNRISFAEGRFCWSKPLKFSGNAYCREHQKTF